MTPVEGALLENLQSFVAFARKRVGDPQLAEDLVQDSLLKALAAERQPGEEEDVVRWFYRILRHSIVDLQRRREVAERALSQLQADLSEEPDAEAERILCQCFKRLLPGLSEPYKDVLQRIDLGGQSPADAAAALGLTTNNLNVRLHRARASLREKLIENCKACSKHGCLDCTCGH